MLKLLLAAVAVCSVAAAIGFAEARSQSLRFIILTYLLGFVALCMVGAAL